MPCFTKNNIVLTTTSDNIFFINMTWSFKILQPNFMKNLFRASIILILFTACEEEPITRKTEPVRAIDSEVSVLVNTFYQEAAARHIALPNALIVEITTQPASHRHEAGQFIVTLERARLDAYDDQQKEAYVNFYLGRVLLDRRLLVYTYSFMNPGLWFGYDPADRDYLYDELFQ